VPQQRTVRDRHRYWCPEFFEPWKTCVRDTTKTVWCYEFAWRHETAYGFVASEEGCENGQLYSWTEPCFFVFGSRYAPGGEMCFDSPRSHEGRCSPTLGASAQPLKSARRPIRIVLLLAVAAVVIWRRRR
jgi:hypothetical protein